jgi:hypothetical protein
VAGGQTIVASGQKIVAGVRKIMAGGQKIVVSKGRSFTGAAFLAKFPAKTRKREVFRGRMSNLRLFLRLLGPRSTDYRGFWAECFENYGHDYCTSRYQKMLHNGALLQ